MSLIKRWGDSVEEAAKRMGEMRKGGIVPLKTGISHLDNKLLGGFLGGEIIVIAGLSGHGKSYDLQMIERNIFNQFMNPNKNIVLLRYNLEMTVFNIFLRSLQHKTKEPLTKILFTEEVSRAAINEVYKKERRDNIYHVETIITPEEFIFETESFLEENKDKDNVVVSIDHIALFKGNDEKKAIDQIMFACIEFKKKYQNATFIILSQLNREIEKRTNPMELSPRMSDLFQSSTMQHGADLVLIEHNPYLLGHQAYIPLGVDNNLHLREFFITGGMNPIDRLKTDYCKYYHYVKLRTEDRREPSPRIYATHLPGSKFLASHHNNNSNTQDVIKDTNNDNPFGNYQIDFDNRTDSPF